MRIATWNVNGIRARFDEVDSCIVLKDEGTSDHAPVVVDLER